MRADHKMDREETEIFNRSISLLSHRVTEILDTASEGHAYVFDAEDFQLLTGWILLGQMASIKGSLQELVSEIKDLKLTIDKIQF